MEKLTPKIDIYAGPKRLEKKMEEQKLCPSCINWLVEKYGERTYFPPYQHCHHLPQPEKPPCRWCEAWRQIKLTWHDTPFWKQINYLTTKSDEPLDKCPICGGKI